MKERLTEKDYCGYDIANRKDFNGYDNEDDCERIFACLQKLGQLEDVLEKYNLDNATDLDIEIRANRDKVYKYESLDKQLDFDNALFVKAITNGIWYKCSFGYDKGQIFYVKHPALICEVSKLKLCFKPNIYEFLFLDDYCKTWALTREELEND